ncbi:MAG TPA: alanine--tRNA ligase, partial [Acholeplasmataceae bacterium]|nr:alanine--tRNA ligase [Acholeplasmataceae bacterium]
TKEILEESDFTVDEEGFKREMDHQRDRARKARAGSSFMGSETTVFHQLDASLSSHFEGYETTDIIDAMITAITKENELLEKAVQGEEISVMTDKTPFYGESGGQVGDKGVVKFSGNEFNVLDTIKLPNEQNASLVDLGNFTITLGSEVELAIDEDFRNQVIKNHTVTHLLNESLRVVLGPHVQQHGSYVGSEGLRFDFNNYSQPTNEEILKIEELVNSEINKAVDVKISYHPLEEARKMNVQAVFGEKYGEVVRVVDTDFSKELCGGCHVKNTKEIEKFAITSLESKGSGIFRIEASTANNIKPYLEKVLTNIHSEINDLLNKQANILKEAAELNLKLEAKEFKLSELTLSYESIINRRNELNELRENVKELDKLFNKLKKEATQISLDDYLENNLTINNYNVLISKTNNLETDILKDLVDRLSDKLDNSIVLLANVTDKNIVFVCKNKIDSLHAGKLVKEAAMVTGGNGGGRGDFAQAGGKDATKVDEALAKAKLMIESII